ncbi:MAG TPA: hypothetical protein VGB95_05470 [Chitinophagales bacterium]
MKKKLTLLFSLIFIIANSQSTTYLETETFSTIIKSLDDTFEKANILRKLVADTIDGGTLNDSLNAFFYKTSFDSFKIEPYMLNFKNDKGAATCGLAASLLTKILNNNGITAYSYNWGIKNTNLTHVIVLAKISSQPEIWSIQDPYFNYTILDSSNCPKDFFELLYELKQQNSSNIKIRQDTTTRTMLFSLKKAQNIDKTCFEQLKNHGLVYQVNDSTFKMRTYLNNVVFKECETINSTKLFFDALERQGLPRNFLYGYLLKINKVWGKNTNAFQERINAVLKQ